MSDNTQLDAAPVELQSPQASASTNSATRASYSVVDGISQENGVPSRGGDGSRSDSQIGVSGERVEQKVGELNQWSAPYVGVRFGNWVVIGPAPSKRQTRHVMARCDCGTEQSVGLSRLRLGGSRSCRACIHLLLRRHGHSANDNQTPTYKTWVAMKRRCSNAKADHAAAYVARGIKVCERWQGFDAFLEDMGEKPSKAYSIDRINNDRGYSCGKCADCQSRGEVANCRWATRFQQMQNTRTTTLNVDIVNEIRGRYEHGEGHASIAVRMSLPRRQIFDVCARRTWKDIP